MPIDTKAVTDRRSLAFNAFADIRRDLDALEGGQRAGTLRAAGNWTPGQIFTHLAAFINYPYDGYPPELAHPPLMIRLILKVMRKKFLHGRMPAGVKIPRIPNGTMGMRDVPFDEGLGILRRALDRLEKSPPNAPNPIFGPLSHEDWMSIHKRHAELHLSFLHPK